MFHSATIKLTAWYLGIVIAVSLLFSVIIYSIATIEVGSRIDYIQRSMRLTLDLEADAYDAIRDKQVHEAEVNLLVSLIVTNVCIWVAGGVGSYYLARRTLTPIEEAHEAQSRFTSDASHELRTPLATMKTELEVALRDTTLSKEEMHELLTSNLEEVNKLTQLSQTLLQLSRLEHESIKLERVKLESAIYEVMKRFDKTKDRFVFNVKKIPTVHANRTSLEELLTILLDNAIKYSPPDSPLTISLITEKSMSGFEVSNQGQGMSEDVLPHIFDRFYRADTSRTGGEKKGYGLGLSLAKKITQINNGELSVSSAPNELTTFRVLLPNSKSAQRTSPTSR